MLDYIKTNIDPTEALNMTYTIYKFPALEIEQLQNTTRISRWKII